MAILGGDIRGFCLLSYCPVDDDLRGFLKPRRSNEGRRREDLAPKRGRLVRPANILHRTYVLVKDQKSPLNPSVGAVMVPDPAREPPLQEGAPD